jgi:hypothetical protein
MYSKKNYSSKCCWKNPQSCMARKELPCVAVRRYPSHHIIIGLLCNYNYCIVQVIVHEQNSSDDCDIR